MMYSMSITMGVEQHSNVKCETMKKYHFMLQLYVHKHKINLVVSGSKFTGICIHKIVFKIKLFTILVYVLHVS